MIVKKLRLKHKWSQEQLAELCGLSVRTIQRVESGNEVSLETLRSLASVFEVDISTFTEEITMIDKESDDWKQLPWWFRANMWGFRNRRPVIIIELLVLFIGCVSLVFWNTELAMIAYLSAYLTGWITRYGDSRQVW
ncbi:helix-turn-helix domain-containing protein [Porticoccaceae bacterium]|nr:helix-turn-helix domain-containing protein [Porticoccaceae bacterium]